MAGCIWTMSGLWMRYLMRQINIELMTPPHGENNILVNLVSGWILWSPLFISRFSKIREIHLHPFYGRRLYPFLVYYVSFACKPNTTYFVPLNTMLHITSTITNRWILHITLYILRHIWNRQASSCIESTLFLEIHRFRVALKRDVRVGSIFVLEPPRAFISYSWRDLLLLLLHAMGQIVFIIPENFTIYRVEVKHRRVFPLPRSLDTSFSCVRIDIHDTK